VASRLPAFTADGLLPPGDYTLTLTDLLHSHLVTGQGVGSTTWDSTWRERLVRNLGILADQLAQVGVAEIFVDGSFVEDKDHPNDIDGYFVCDEAPVVSGRLEEELNRCDPHRCWTWSAARRRWDPASGKAQLPMWFVYRVELYPHFGQGTGLLDRYRHELLFPSLFRQSRRDEQEKGIIRLLQGEPS
jgi:hypothetical protein